MYHPWLYRKQIGLLVQEFNIISEFYSQGQQQATDMGNWACLNHISVLNTQHRQKKYAFLVLLCADLTGRIQHHLLLLIMLTCAPKLREFSMHVRVQYARYIL